MTKKTCNQYEANRISEVGESIDKACIDSCNQNDGSIRIKLFNGRTLTGRATGGSTYVHLREIDEDAKKAESDLHSGEVEITDLDGEIHLIDYLDIETVDVASSDLLN
jgi:hypothetical protein